ncbi:hypothetical protein O6R05_01435 [Peptoniphilus equinus]|uniref:Uncharacterized protein n=1 Tax=Peptoniphilus equinus TaxID=3016343 RepID=A0ABY7QU23_9FIRM|nr:hypothetical protein [Peptoniphilus equinus]WBW50232.1 hypothetical protein O6R05_01435 [Peptoniphilus equinus]
MIIDDSLGALLFLNWTQGDDSVLIDTALAPLSLRPVTAAHRAKVLGEFSVTTPIVTNPVLGGYIDSINGLDAFNRAYASEPGLVIAPKPFAETYGGVASELLRNTVLDGKSVPYIVNNICDSLITASHVYIMDSVLHYYREYFTTRYPKTVFHYLFDFIGETCRETRTGRRRIYVTGSPRQFRDQMRSVLGQTGDVRHVALEGETLSRQWHRVTALWRSYHDH